MDQIRRDHGHRAVAGLTKDRIEEKILKPLHNKPGAKIDTLKKLRILIRHAKDDLKWLSVDPSDGIKRGKSKEIRAWTDTEMKAFEDRWAYGTRQRAAYELMLNVGTARIDTHLTTWVQADADDFEYTRRKTGVSVLVEKAQSLRAALAALPRKHVCILTTEWGKPFTVDGLQRVDARCDDRGGGRRAILKLEDHKANRIPQTSSSGLGKPSKKGKEIKMKGRSLALPRGIEPLFQP